MSTPGYRRQCPGCTSWFVICLPCDRWHWYCSAECKDQARRASRRKSSRKYRRSGRGRRSNRKAQARHRLGKPRKKSVSHHSSATAALSPTIREHPNDRDAIQPHGRKELTYGYQTEVRTDLAVAIQDATQGQAVLAKDPSSIDRIVSRASPTKPTSRASDYPTGTCRVCRRLVTHLVTFDGLGKSPRPRGPPCSRMT